MPENLFFMSIDEFDKFMFCFDGNVEEMIKKLQDINEIDQNPRNRKYNFGLYLESELKKVNFEDHYLHGVFENFIESIKQALE